MNAEQKYKINEYQSSFRIRYRENGKQFEIRRHFNEANKESKLDEMKVEQRKLIESFPIEIDLRTQKQKNADRDKIYYQKNRDKILLQKKAARTKTTVTSSIA